MALLVTRRRAQHDLLAKACEHRQRARLVLAGLAVEAPPINTRFLALLSDALLLEWPLGGAKYIPPRDALIDVFFEHAQKRYTFRSTTQGREWWWCERRGGVAAWRLTLPLRVEPGQQRAHYRISLADLDPVRVRFADVSDPARSFVAGVTNLSAGGLGAIASQADAAAVAVNDLLWTTFRLPDDCEIFEFIVRVMHRRDVPHNATTVLGCMFCPGEDPELHRDRIVRVQRFVAARDLAKARRARGRDGEEP